MGKRNKRKARQRKKAADASSTHTSTSSNRPAGGTANAHTSSNATAASRNGSGRHIATDTTPAVGGGAQTAEANAWNSDTPYLVDIACALLLSLESVPAALRSLCCSPVLFSDQTNASANAPANTASSRSPYSNVDGVETVAVGGGGLMRSRQQLLLAQQEFAIRHFDQVRIRCV
jgi:hypothetical protein